MSSNKSRKLLTTAHASRSGPSPPLELTRCDRQVSSPRSFHPFLLLPSHEDVCDVTNDNGAVSTLEGALDEPAAKVEGIPVILIGTTVFVAVGIVALPVALTASLELDNVAGVSEELVAGAFGALDDASLLSLVAALLSISEVLTA